MMMMMMMTMTMMTPSDFFQAVTSLQPIQYRIHFLDGKTKTVSLNPEDVAADAVLKVAEKIGLRIPSGWAIYEVGGTGVVEPLTSLIGVALAPFT